MCWRGRWEGGAAVDSVRRGSGTSCLSFAKFSSWFSPGQGPSTEPGPARLLPPRCRSRTRCTGSRPGIPSRTRSLCRCAPGPSHGTPAYASRSETGENKESNEENNNKYHVMMELFTCWLAAVLRY